MSTPATTRLDVDERRRRLLELGGELFARHAYEELSIARIAREPAPALRAAVRGWLWFVDGAVLDWIEHRDIDRRAA